MSLEELGHTILEFVKLHQAWAAPIVFALAFAESLAFLSFIVPAWAVLVGIGAMMKTGGIAFLPVLLAGALGAALGDWLSYWLGHLLQDRLPRMWPFRAHPDLLKRGEALIAKWGALAIFIGRFSGPLRADRRRHAGHAASDVSDRQLHVGAGLGGGAAGARRRRRAGVGMGVEVAGEGLGVRPHCAARKHAAHSGYTCSTLPIRAAPDPLLRPPQLRELSSSQRRFSHREKLIELRRAHRRG